MLHRYYYVAGKGTSSFSMYYYVAGDGTSSFSTQRSQRTDMEN
jgi:hypothetical protein